MSRAYWDAVEELRQRPLPQHVAIVPDGNGRWAQKRGLLRAAGHRAGVESLKVIVRSARDVGIPYLTVFAFSTENWTRPKDEVDELMRLLVEYLDSGVEENKRNGVRVKIIGRKQGLSDSLIEAIGRAEAETAGGQKIGLGVAFNYGGRAELVDAARAIAIQAREGRLLPEAIDEHVFSSYLYEPLSPDPDVIIRTSGEMRISNFLLWQCAYAEFVSSPGFWPDFGPTEFFDCIREFQQRDRRFGGIRT